MKSITVMDFVSLRDLYDLVQYLNEKDLFGLYESAFSETKKKYPLIDKKEAGLTQKNEEIREVIGNVEKYKDPDRLKEGIFTIYCREMKKEIPEDMLKEFLDDIIANLREKIISHPKIRDKLHFLLTEDISKQTREIPQLRRLIEQSLQCKPSNGIQTPEGWCKIDRLTEGFIGKVRLVLGGQHEILGEVNYRKVLGLVEKMEGNPEYAARNAELASEVCNILIESFDHLPQDARDARIVFSVILSKLTEFSEFLESCDLPSNHGEVNFQAFITLATIALNRGEIDSARAYLEKLREYAENGEKVLTAILEGRILIKEYHIDKAIAQFESVLVDADFYEKKVILFYLGFACHLRSSLAKSLKYWSELEGIEDDRKKRSVIVGNIGLIYYVRGELDEALKHHTEALDIDREIGYMQGEANQLGNIGLIYRDRGELDEALKYHTEALDIDREIGYKQGEASDLGNIGLICRAKGEFDEALKHHTEALDVDKEIGYKQGEANQLGNIGLIYYVRGELDEALKYLTEALDIHREIGYKQGEANQLGNIGLIYHVRGELDEALKHHTRALEIVREIGYKQGEADQIGNIGLIYSAKGEFDEALKYHTEALDIDREIGYKQGEASDLGNIGLIYGGKGELNEALVYLEEALKILDNYRLTHGRDAICNAINLITEFMK